MQTSQKIINMAIWDFQLPLSVFHALCMGGKMPPPIILKYPKMSKSVLKLFEILETKMQEAQLIINTMYLCRLALLSNKETYDTEVLVLMSSGKLHKEKKNT